MKTTPLPWDYICFGDQKYVIDAKSGKVDVAQIVARTEREETEHIARFIVTACNHHDEMLETLLMVQKRLESTGGYPNFTSQEVIKLHQLVEKVSGREK